MDTIESAPLAPGNDSPLGRIVIRLAYQVGGCHHPAAGARRNRLEMCLIRRFAVSNFKSIGPEVALDLAGLTVFAGPNSAGKSSLLQGLMVLAQSAGSPYSKQPIELRGYLVDLGTFLDTSHRGADRSIRLTCTTHFTPSSDAMSDVEAAGFDVDLNVEFSRDPKVWQGGSDVRLDRLDLVCKTLGGAEAAIRIRRRRGGPRPKGPFPTPVSGEILVTQQNYLLEISGSQLEQLPPGPLRFDEPEARLPTAIQLRGAIPGLILFPYDPIARQAGYVLRQVLRLNLGAPVSTRVTRLLGNTEILDCFMQFWHDPLVAELAGEVPANRADAIALARRLSIAKRSKLRQAVTEYLNMVQHRDDATVAFDRLPPSPLLAEAATATGAALSDIRHLGPLREPPRPFHRTPTSGDPRSVGRSGEYTAAVLHRFGSEPVEFTVDGKTQHLSLQRAVDFWLTRMGVHSGAHAIEYGRMGHFIGVEDPAVGNRYLDLTQVGVGVSQLLPVLVQVLVAPVGSTVLLEQPELHLHPAVQSHLAEFLLSASASGRQVVCETHSEYLVNRLRVFVAQNHELSTSFNVYFVTRTEGTTSVQQVTFGPKGYVSDWPQGFFDQSVMDASDLLDAGLRRD